MGDRLFAEYQVINIQKDHNGKTPNHVIVGNYKYTNVRIAQPTITFVILQISRTPTKWFFQSMMTRLSGQADQSRRFIYLVDTSFTIFPFLETSQVGWWFPLISRCWPSWKGLSSTSGTRPSGCLARRGARARAGWSALSTWTARGSGAASAAGATAWTSWRSSAGPATSPTAFTSAWRATTAT